MSVIANNIVAGAAGQGGADAAYEISRSLRFNSSDSANLSRNFASAGNRKTWTWSGWVKRPKLNSASLWLCNFDINGYNGFNFGFTSASGSIPADAIRIIELGVSSPDTQLTTTQVFRDPSAWYHVVLAYDTTQATAANRVKLYVNGVQITTFSTATYPSQNFDGYVNKAETYYIGKVGAIAAYHDDYLADIHFIDGQALAATDFGEYDDNNVWQPKAYSGSYGTNGFHLPFDDNSSAAALGYDAAGSNDWTVNNISVLNGNGNFVSGVSGAQTTNEVAANLFDGNTGTYCSATTNGGTVTVTFTPSRSVASSTRIFNGSSTLNVAVNGGSAVNYTGAGWKDLGFTGTLTSISFTHGSGAIGSMNAIELDGTILLDNSVVGRNNDSLVDSPTNGTQTDTGAGGEVVGNYATLNPLHALSTSSSFTNGNLEATVYGSSSRTRQVFSTINPTSGKFYFEITPTAIGTTMVGLFSPVSDSNVGTSRLAIYRSDRYIFKDGSSLGQVASTYAANDVIGVAYDIEGSEVKFYKNGTLDYTISSFTNSLAGAIPGFGCDSSTTSTFTTAVANFGQRPFAYTAPSGYKALCTTNLPDPTIADGSTAMDVVTYTGNGSTQTISGLNFSPDLVWLKSRSQAYYHILVDSVRGNTKELYSNDTTAEQTTTNTVTAFNSDGFSLGNRANTNQSSATYLAWAWDAGDSTTTIAAGGLNSSAYNQSQTWSNSLTGNNLTGATNAFDGSTSTIAQSPNAAGAFLMLTHTFTNVTSLRVYANNPTTNEMRLNNTGSYTAESALGASNNGGWRDLTSLIPSNGTVTHIEARTTTSSGVNWAAIEVNGALLIDSGVSVPNVPSIATTVRARPETGFSIANYTGNATAGATFAHGLNAVPDMIIIKARDSVADGSWIVGHSAMGLGYARLLLNSTAVNNGTPGNVVAYDLWNNTAATSSVVSIGSYNAVNDSGDDYIAYCFTAVDGYSSAFTYIGNGSSDGPMVYLGHRPRFLLIKASDFSENWTIIDTARDTYNASGLVLQPNDSSAEVNWKSSYPLDLLSNGFKLRNVGSRTNKSGVTYIGFAFAENPFKTARAR